jgi:prepilin signal peptidase PulO-like enzyme (type II secretory pathway)
MSKPPNQSAVAQLFSLGGITHHTIMIKKHTVSFGAIIGLVIGVIAFVSGLSLPPDSFLSKAVEVSQSPLLPVIAWMQKASHQWGSNTDLFKLMAVILCYWTLLGLLVGLGCRLIIGRRSSHAA